MTKKQIEEMYSNMVNSCNVVKSLYKKGFFDYSKSNEKIDNYLKEYMDTLNGLLLFGVINVNKHDFGFDLIKNFDIELFDL